MRASVYKGVMWLLSAAVLAGCVQTKTTPGYARPGDHIVVGLGGVERNANGESLLRASDLTITLTDAQSMQYELEARFIFRSYLDYAAYLNGLTIDGSNATLGLNGMVPYDGGWFVVAPLTVPGQYNNPLPLAVGPAEIEVSSAKLNNTGVAPDSLEGNLASVPLEILPGSAPQDTDFVRQFVSYEATENRFLITPQDLSGVGEAGGAYLVIEYFNETFFKAGVEPLVVPVNHNPYVQLNYNVVSNGNGTGTIYVTLLNPAGFTTLANAQANTSLLSDLSVNLVYFASNGASVAEAKATFSLDAASSYYIDTNGAELASLTPVMTHVADL